MGVKASGGIRTLEDLKSMTAAGATRVGASASVKIIEATAVGQWAASPRKTSAPFHERAELLDFLLEVSRITAETLDLDKLLESVASIVRNVIDYDVFAIFLHNEREKGLRIRYSMGHREEVVRSLMIPVGEGVVGAAAASRVAVMVDDVRKDPRYMNALDAVRSELAVPMLARGKLVGVLDVESTRLNTRAGSRTLLRRLTSPGGRVRSTMRGCICAWSAKTGPYARWRICRRNSVPFSISTNCWARSPSAFGR